MSSTTEKRYTLTDFGKATYNQRYTLMKWLDGHGIDHLNIVEFRQVANHLSVIHYPYAPLETIQDSVLDTLMLEYLIYDSDFPWEVLQPSEIKEVTL